MTEAFKIDASELFPPGRGTRKAKWYDEGYQAGLKAGLDEGYQAGLKAGAQALPKSSMGDLRVAVAVYRDDGKLMYQNAFLTLPGMSPELALKDASDQDLWDELTRRREAERAWARDTIDSES